MEFLKHLFDYIKLYFAGESALLRIIALLQKENQILKRELISMGKKIRISYRKLEAISEESLGLSVRLRFYDRGYSIQSQALSLFPDEAEKQKDHALRHLHNLVKEYVLY